MKRIAVLIKGNTNNKVIDTINKISKKAINLGIDCNEVSFTYSVTKRKWKIKAEENEKIKELKKYAESIQCEKYS